MAGGSALILQHLLKGNALLSVPGGCGVRHVVGGDVQLGSPRDGARSGGVYAVSHFKPFPFETLNRRRRSRLKFAAQLEVRLFGPTLRGVKKAPRLERALHALARERSHVQRDLTEVQNRRAVMSNAVDRLNKCRSAVAETAIVDDEGRLNPDVFLVARTAEARMTEEITTLNARIQRFDEEITIPVQERLKAAAVREKAVETLVGRRRDQARRQDWRRETLEMDEFARLRWRNLKSD